MGLDNDLYVSGVEAPVCPSTKLNHALEFMAPPPPEGQVWWQVFSWRKHYFLDHVLCEGMGSPDYRFLELPDLLKFQEAYMAEWELDTAGVTAVTERSIHYRKKDARMLVFAKAWLREGRQVMISRCS